MVVFLASFAYANGIVISTESDYTYGTFSDMQLNINPSGTCDASRYISTGYDYPNTSTNPSGTCNRCDGSGNNEYIANGQDPFSECGTTNCLTGTCSGSGSCGYYTSGQHNCEDGYVCNNGGNCEVNIWIGGYCGLEVYPTDFHYLAWKTSDTRCYSPQCYPIIYQIGADLVADNNVDFSEYPARNACKSIGGRMPSYTQLQCMNTNSVVAGYGLLVGERYWSSTEIYNTAYNHYKSARMVIIGSSGSARGYKTTDSIMYVRCIR